MIYIYYLSCLALVVFIGVAIKKVLDRNKELNVLYSKYQKDILNLRERKERNENKENDLTEEDITSSFNASKESILESTKPTFRKLILGIAICFICCILFLVLDIII